LIPEIRAQERLEEAAVALIPHLRRSAREQLLHTWRDLGFPDAGPPPEIAHDQAWQALREIIHQGRV